MNPQTLLNLSDEETLKYPMLYQFPELDDHWGEDVKKSTFVTSDLYNKAYSRIEELKRDKKELRGQHQGLQDVIKDLEAQIKELKNNHKCFDFCWIPVDEMLPDFHFKDNEGNDRANYVYCCLKSKYDGSPKYKHLCRSPHGDEWFWCDETGDQDDYPVTHWVPLSEAPIKYQGLKPEVW